MNSGVHWKAYTFVCSSGKRLCHRWSTAVSCLDSCSGTRVHSHAHSLAMHMAEQAGGGAQASSTVW